MGNNSSIENTALLLSARPLRRPRWVRQSKKARAATKEAEILARRLDQKCDALAESVQTLFRAGTLTRLEVGRVLRKIAHVEAQATHNKAQLPRLLPRFLDQPDFETFQIGNALGPDSDSVLEDCARLRECLLDSDAYGNYKLLTMRSLYGLQALAALIEDLSLKVFSVLSSLSGSEPLH